MKCDIKNKIADANMAAKKAGLLNFKGLNPADFITKISLSFWSFKYEIIHPAKVPNGKAIRSQLGRLYADNTKNSESPAPLLIINLMLLKDWVNHIIPTKTHVEINKFLNVCLNIYQDKIIKTFLKNYIEIFLNIYSTITNLD